MLPVVDVRGWFEKTCGEVGWPPSAFYEAQLWECALALRGARRGAGYRDARQAAWIVNGMRRAFHAKKFKPLEAEDIYDPDYRPPTKEEIDAERRAVASSFAPTLTR